MIVSVLRGSSVGPEAYFYKARNPTLGFLASQALLQSQKALLPGNLLAPIAADVASRTAESLSRPRGNKVWGVQSSLLGRLLLELEQIGVTAWILLADEANTRTVVLLLYFPVD